MNDPIDLDYFDLQRLDMFWSFVCERQDIWHRRFVERIPRPWSKDPIFQTERFTNVYRELDPGTQYLFEEILGKDAEDKDKVFNIMIYRLIGRSETHRAVGFQYLEYFNGKRLEAMLKHIRDELHKPPFTAAYMVSAYGGMGTNDKIENVVRLFMQLQSRFASFYETLAAANSAMSAYNTIRNEYGFGNFLAYQVLVDLLYPMEKYNKPLLPFSHDDWASAGPGAQRGISLIAKMRQPARDLEVMRWLRTNQDLEFKRIGISFHNLRNRSNKKIPVSLANIQNCLCEFHKYCKIKEGRGKGRRKFIPATPAQLGAAEQFLFGFARIGESG